MVGKNNQEVLNQKTGRQVNRYGIRRLSVGVASVAVAGLLFASNAALVQAAEVGNDGIISETSNIVEGNESAEAVSTLIEKPEDGVNNGEVEPLGDPSSNPGVEKSQADLFEAVLSTIEVKQNEAVDYHKAITNLPADAKLSPVGAVDTAELGTHTIEVEIVFSDGSSKSVNVSVNITEKTIENDATDTKAGEDLDGSPEDSKSNLKNINLFAVEPEFNGTTVKTVIVKNGIGESDFNFAGIFGENPDTKVTLTNKADGSVQVATFNAEDGTITFEDPVSMDDVKNGDVSIKFSGTSIAGKFIQNESTASYNGTSNITTFTLTLSQYRNNDVVVTTVDKKNVSATNPDSTATGGTIKMTSGNGRSRGISIPSDNNETSVARRATSRNIDDYNKGIRVVVTNQENGFLVDKEDGNKVYKTEIKPDPDGLKPTEINFTEKPLVTTTDDAGDDKDYAKVTFVVGDKGENPSETSKAVIKGVEHDGKISAPANTTGKKGYTFKGWSNGGVQDVYKEDTTHEALFDVVAPKGQDITVKQDETPNAEDAITNKDDLPEGTKYEFKEPVDTTTDGTKDATVVVTYPDGSTEEVPVKVNVTIDASTITPIPSVTADAETVDFGGEYDLTDNITNLPEGATVEDVTPAGTIDVNKSGNYTGKVKVTFENGSSKVVDVSVTVGDSQAATNEPKGQDITVKKGETPKAEDAITNKDDLPEGTKYEFKEPVDTTTDDTKDATVVVTYPDGSSEEINVKVNVMIDASTITPIPAVTAEAETVDFGGEYDLTDNITNLPEGATVEDVTPAGTIDVNKSGDYTGKVKVTFENGSSKVVDVPVTVGESQAATNTPEGEDITVKKGETPKAEDAISNLTDLPEGTTVDWKETPDTGTTGEKPATVVVTYPDGTTDEKEVTVVVKNSIPAKPIENIAKTTKVTTEKVPGKVKYEADDSLDFEEQVVDKAPEDGEKKVTTVSQPGKDAVVTEKVTKEPVDGITKVGNKKVETVENEDGSTTETTTIYDVDPETGELTNPTTTIKTTPAEEYLVVFNGNGGSPVTQKVTVKDGSSVSVIEPTREGYKFVKWVKVGTNIEFDPKTPFSKEILDGDNSLFLTAIWEKETSQNGGSAVFYPKESHPIFKTVGDSLTEEEVTNAIVVLGLDRNQYKVTINQGQSLPSTDQAGQAIVDVTITFEDGTTDDAQVAIIITEPADTTAPTIDAANVIAVEGQPIPPVMVDVDDLDATVTVEGLPEGLTYNPEIKQIEGTIAKADDWEDAEEVRTQSATITVTDEAGNTTTDDITITILRDTDGDGTPDVTDIDDDNDGVDDLTEKSEGTDPKDAESKPEIADEENEDNNPSDADDKPSDDDSKPSDEDSKPSDNGEDDGEESTKSLAEEIDVQLPAKTGVKDINHLTDIEKETVKIAIADANDFPKGTEILVGLKGDAIINYPDGSHDVIDGEDLVYQLAGESGLAPADSDAKPDADADQKPAADADQDLASKDGDQASDGQSKDASKAEASEDLPQTGESSSAAILGLAGLSIMAGLGLVAGRRKEDN